MPQEPKKEPTRNEKIRETIAKGRRLTHAMKNVLETLGTLAQTEDGNDGRPTDAQGKNA